MHEPLSVKNKRAYQTYTFKTRRGSDSFAVFALS